MEYIGKRSIFKMGDFGTENTTLMFRGKGSRSN